MTTESLKLEIASKRLPRRALLLGGIQLAIVAAISGRLVYLQTSASENFRNLAEANRVNIRLIPPERGIIVDRNGEILANNRQEYLVTIVREQAGDVEMILNRLAKIVPMSNERISELVSEINDKRPDFPILVSKEISWEQVTVISVNAPVLPGVNCDFGNIRMYPHSEIFAHNIGYVGAPDDKDLLDPNDNDPLLHYPNFRIGKSGIELAYDRPLRGTAGRHIFEVNATGRVIRELDRRESTAGKKITLTLDQKLQSYVVNRLGTEAGTCVVMDILTGELLCLVSMPTFDPNKFSTGISHTDFNQYLSNKRSPLFDRSTQGSYPPGSTFKMITALAALENGLITPDDHFYCNGTYESVNRTFHCWKSQGHGKVNLQKSISESCDVYYYNLAERVGIEKIAEIAGRLGLGKQHGLKLSGNTKGNIPTKEWKVSKIGEQWVIGDSLNAAIGQGYVLVSSIQLAVMVARIASGKQVKPQLLRQINDQSFLDIIFKPLDLNPDMLTLIRKSMRAVVNERTGTAYLSRCIDPDFELAGKTGTSQTKAISRSQRLGLIDSEDIPWDERDHALFCAYAPYSTPRYAITVIVEHGGGGASVAAPIARDILMFLYYGGLPPLTAYPENQREEIRLKREESNPSIEQADNQIWVSA